MIFSFTALFICLSGSICTSIIYGVKPGRMIPVTLMSIVAVLYLFGMAGCLAAGVNIVLIIIIILYITAILYAIKIHMDFKILLKKIFTPAVIIFTVVFAFLQVLNAGMVLHNWDEFSHWGDVVKAMSYIDDFATNARSHSTFRSYPPGMALLQYFFQKLHMKLEYHRTFSEWRLYAVYQIFALSMIFPFMEKEKQRKTEKIAVLVSSCILPLIFYQDFYSMVYIDPFVSILSGTAMAMVLFHDCNDRIYDISIFLLCVNLVLSKDIGFYFAVIVSILYSVDKIVRLISERKESIEIKRTKNFVGGGKYLYLLIPFILTIFTKFSWDWKIRISGIEASFSSKIQVLEYFKIFFLHGDSTYKQEVVDKAKDAFFEYTVQLGGYSISYFSLLILSILVLLLIAVRLYRTAEILSRLRRGIIVIIPVMSVILYAFFIGAIYAFRFSEYEASNLASYTRYMNIAFYALWIIILIGIFHITFSKKNGNILSVSIVCICLIIAPMGNIENWFSRDTLRAAQNIRLKYTSLSDEILKQCDGNDKIYFLSRGNNGFDYWVTRFNARPNSVEVPFGGWSLGGAVNSEDIWYWDVSASEWMSALIEGNYDYVAIYQLGDDFAENYGSCFEKISDLQDNSLFLLNRNKKILERCE